MEATTTTSIAVIPSYDQLKETPKTFYDGMWMLFVPIFICSLWFAKDYSKQSLLEKQETFKAKLAAEKALSEERAKLITEREETIDFQQEIIKTLYAERSFLMKATGIDSEVLKNEVK